MYYGNKTPNVQKNTEKKGFTISKKRKLYSDKDLQDFWFITRTYLRIPINYHTVTNGSKEYYLMLVIYT